MDSSVHQHDDDVRCADAVSATGDELVRPGDLKRVAEVADEAPSGHVVDARHGVHHASLVELVVVEVELVAGGRWRRVADEADARVVRADVQFGDDFVDEVEYRPPICTRRITAADRPRTIDHEDDVCPRRLARHSHYHRTNQQHS